MAIANAGQVTVEFVAETQKAIGEVKKFGTSLKNVESDFVSLEKVGSRLAAVFSGAVIAGFVKQALAAADATGDAAERIGIAASSLSRLQFAAQQTDVEFSALTSGIQRFQVAVSKASDENRVAQQTLAQFGVRAQDIIALPIEQQLASVAAAFQNITNPADRTRLAVELFGRSAGPQLVPLLAQGTQGLEELLAAADRLGITLDDRATKAIDRSTKALERFVQATKSGTANIVGGFLANTFGSGDELLDLQARLDELNRRKEFLLAGPAGGSTIQGSALSDELARINAEALSIEQRFRDLENLTKTRAIPAASAISAEIQPFQIVGAQRIDTDAIEEAALDAEINAAKFQRAADFEREMAELRVSSAKAVNEQVLADTTAYLERQNQIVTAAVENEARIKQEAAEREKQLRNSVLDQAIGTFALLAATSKKGAKIQKGVAAANAARNTYEAVTKALTAGGPFAIPAAIAIGAFGFAQVAAILRTSDTGGGLSPVSGGGRGFANVAPSQQTSDQQPFGATSRDAVQVIINGDVFSSRETADWIIEQIGEAVERDQFPFSPSSRFSQQIREGGA